MTGVIAGSMLIGGIGGTLLQVIPVSAQSPTPAPSAVVSPSPDSSGGSVAPGGKFKSNENPTHEAKESPAREAQEDAGQRPTVK